MSRLAPRAAGLLAVVLLAVAACGDDDGPTREETVRMLEVECQRQLGQVEALADPGSIQELESAAGQAFGIMRATRDDLDGRDLRDDEEVDRYLQGAGDLIGAVSEVSLAAGQQDLDRLRAALERVEESRADLDEVTLDLGMPDRCGSQAWGSTLLDRAAGVADEETYLLAPSGDYPADAGRYCSRYRRATASAPEATGTEEDRRYVATYGRALGLLHDQLGQLDPPEEHADAHQRLLEVLDEATSDLQENEAVTSEADEAQLRELVERTQGRVAEVDGLLDELAVDCEA